MVVPTCIDRLTLSRNQLPRYLGFVIRHFLSNLDEARCQILILRLLGQRLRPVESQIEMAAAVIDFSDFARWRFIALQELGIGLIKGIRQHFRRGIVRHFGQMLQRGSQRQEVSERIPPQIAFFLELLHVLRSQTDRRR